MSSGADRRPGRGPLADAFPVMHTRVGVDHIPIYEQIHLTERVTVAVRSYYSIAWLTAAEMSRAAASEIGDGPTRPDSVHYDRMRSHVLGAVVGSWAFLESNINELFADASHYSPGSPIAAEARRGLVPELHSRLAVLWPHVERLPPLAKYGIALDLAGADPISPGSDPGQSASLLTRIRSHLLHYQPHSVIDGVPEDQDAKLSTAMRGRVDLPEWNRGGDDLFPTRILCPDLARWCINAAIRFTDEFADRCGTPRSYDHVRPAWL